MTASNGFFLHRLTTNGGYREIHLSETLAVSRDHRSKELAPFYSNTGRPSIDPELMMRMLLVGYVFALRSERRICAEVQVNLAYHWFCRLSIEDRIPDHSVFSRARHERFRESEPDQGGRRPDETHAG
jgi:transposase